MLGRYVNRTVRLSIPILFPDGAPCVGTLISVESAGVWLDSEALTKAVHLHNAPQPAQVFIPFAQIAYIVEATPHPEKADSLKTTHHPEASHHERVAPEKSASAKAKRPIHGSAPRSKHHR